MKVGERSEKGAGAPGGVVGAIGESLGKGVVVEGVVDGHRQEVEAALDRKLEDEGDVAAHVLADDRPVHPLPTDQRTRSTTEEGRIPGSGSPLNPR